MKRRQFAALATANAVALTTSPLWAQDKPPLKILVGFPPGGSVDIVARLLGDKLRVSLGQNVVIDNKPGAGGRVAMGKRWRSPPVACW
jgi:tripartite-type tricarboxylate transporter receptor subunit TctC